MSEETKSTAQEKTKVDTSHEGLAGKVFWGLLLILAGGLLLLGNFGLVNVDWSNVWKLWPLFIVFAGLSVLSFKHIIWRIISVIFALLTIAFIAWVAIGGFDKINFSNNNSKEYTANVEVESEDIKSAVISINSGASNMNIYSANQDSVVEATLDSDFANLSNESEKVGTVQKIDLSMESSGIWFGSFKNDWDVKVTRDLPISFDLDTGASDVNIDFSEALVDLIDIDMGVSDLDLILGNRQKLTEVEISSGVSSIKVKIPESSGVKLNIDEGLTTKKLADLSKVDEGIYQSADYEKAQNKVEIIAKVGVSSFTIEKY